MAPFTMELGAFRPSQLDDWDRTLAMLSKTTGHQQRENSGGFAKLTFNFEP